MLLHWRCTAACPRRTARSPCSGACSTRAARAASRPDSASAPRAGSARTPRPRRSSPARHRRRGAARPRPPCSRPSSGPSSASRAPTASTTPGPSPAPTMMCFVPRRAVHEVPLPQRPLLALDDQQRLAREHEEVLLVGLPVVHPHRLARARARRGDAELREVRSRPRSGRARRGPGGRASAPRAR